MHLTVNKQNNINICNKSNNNNSYCSYCNRQYQHHKLEISHYKQVESQKSHGCEGDKIDELKDHMPIKKGEKLKEQKLNLLFVVLGHR